MAKCAGITQAGTACKGMPIDNSQWCYVHHPEHTEERRRYGSKGGKRGGRGRRASLATAELDRLQHMFEELAEEVRRGEVDAKTGSVIGQIMNYARGCLRDRVAAREQEELVARLEALERAEEKARKFGT
jgi:hypothetical protein